MLITITVDTIVTSAAERWLGRTEPGISERRKAQVITATKYNLLVKAFNASTLLLVVAVACAILFAYAAAVTYGAIAVFVRSTAEGELNEYVQPQRAGLLSQMQYRFSTTIASEEVRNIFGRVGGNIPEDWEPYELNLFGHDLWKREVPIPG